MKHSLLEQRKVSQKSHVARGHLLGAQAKDKKMQEPANRKIQNRKIRYKGKIDIIANNSCQDCLVNDKYKGGDAGDLMAKFSIILLIPNMVN